MPTYGPLIYSAIALLFLIRDIGASELVVSQKISLNLISFASKVLEFLVLIL